MFNRNVKTAVLLPCGAMLALALGCSSTLSNDEPITYSGRNEPSAVGQHEVRSNSSTYSAAPRPSDNRAPAREESPRVVSGNANAGASAVPGNHDSATSAQQQDRVTIVTSKAPPLLQVETPSHEPREGEFWVAGLWRGESGDYVWQAGRIEQERTGQLFVPAHWAPSSRGWEYTPEYWR